MTSHEHDETIVDGAPVAAAKGDDRRPGPGVRVGRYLVLEPLGEGGMATVYLAHDPELHRNVAIKVLHPGSGSQAAVDQARLVREAQALAKLSHPNLVQVYDVGTWHEQVFIAMEYVKGPSLRGWLEQPRPWREVVGILRAAGEGLAAAHQAGLVHRDFKPGNVLVGDDGRVRVADFGLARLGAEEASPPTADEPRASSTDALRTSMTESGVVMGTPAYMAPEQHMGGHVDARSDQYAFCVTLFEGTFGKRPFTVVGRKALLRSKLDGPPSPARAGDVPAWLRRIVTRGLCPEPAGRFETMATLLRALDAGRFRRRRRLGALGLVGALGTMAALGYVSRSGEDQPRCDAAPSPAWGPDERARVDEAFERVDVAHGAEVFRIVSARLDAYARAWEAMHVDACEATHVRGEQSDELLDLRMACLRRRHAEIRAAVGVLADADADADVVDNAVELVAAVPPVEVCGDLEVLRATVPPPESPRLRAEVEALQEQLARARAIDASGRSAEAATEAAAAVTEARELGYEPLLSEALLVHSEAIEAEDPALAETLAREALTTAARGRDDRRQVDAWTALLFNVGQVQARHDDAMSLAVGAEAALARLGDPPSPRASIESALGTVEWGRGHYDEAVRRYELASRLIRESVGEDDPRLRIIINNYGVVMLSLGRLDEAREQFQRGLGHARRTFGSQHPYVADSLLNLGLVYVERGEGATAQQYLEETLEVLRRVPNQNRRRIGQVLANLLVATMQQGRLKESRRYATESLEVLREVHGPEHPHVAASLDGLGMIALIEGDTETAEQHLEQALGLIERTLGTAHPNYAVVGLNIAWLRLAQGRPAEALRLATEAREVLEGSVAEDSAYLVAARSTEAEARVDLGQEAAAIEALERAREVVDDPVARPRYAFALARALHGAGREPGRVRALVIEAAAAYESLGFAHLRETLHRWARDQAGLELP